MFPRHPILERPPPLVQNPANVPKVDTKTTKPVGLSGRPPAPASASGRLEKADFITYAASAFSTDRTIPVTVIVEEKNWQTTWLFGDQQTVHDVRGKCAEVWNCSSTFYVGEKQVYGPTALGALIDTDGTRFRLTSRIVRGYESVKAPRVNIAGYSRTGPRAMIRAFDIDSQRQCCFLQTRSDRISTLVDDVEGGWKKGVALYSSDVKVNTDERIASIDPATHDDSIIAPVASRALSPTDRNYKTDMMMHLQGRPPKGRFRYRNGAITSLHRTCCHAHEEIFDINSPPYGSYPRFEEYGTFRYGKPLAPLLDEQYARTGGDKDASNRQRSRTPRRHRFPSTFTTGGGNIVHVTRPCNPQRYPHSSPEQRNPDKTTQPAPTVQTGKTRAATSKCPDPMTPLVHESVNAVPPKPPKSATKPCPAGSENTTPGNTGNKNVQPQVPGVQKHSTSTSAAPQQKPADDGFTFLGPRKRMEAATEPSSSSNPTEPPPKARSFPTVDEWLGELIGAYSREQPETTKESVSSRKVQHPTSNASACRRDRVPTDSPPLLPRPEDAAPPNVISSDDEQEQMTHQQEFRQLCLKQAEAVWAQLDGAPNAADSLICPEMLAPLVITYLNRGRDFCKLVPTQGINDATKAARQVAKRKGKSYSSAVSTFSSEMNAYKHELMKFRRTRGRGGRIVRFSSCVADQHYKTFCLMLASAILKFVVFHLQRCANLVKNALALRSKPLPIFAGRVW